MFRQRRSGDRETEDVPLEKVTVDSAATTTSEASSRREEEEEDLSEPSDGSHDGTHGGSGDGSDNGSEDGSHSEGNVSTEILR